MARIDGQRIEEIRATLKRDNALIAAGYEPRPFVDIVGNLLDEVELARRVVDAAKANPHNHDKNNAYEIEACAMCQALKAYDALATSAEEDPDHG